METDAVIYKYDAFISYRHNDRDAAIAQKLITLLETFRRKGSRKLRAFRDVDDFPTSSDLGNSIHKALEESRFLIILASPEYLQSKWCMEEVRYFRSLHGNTNYHILPLLVSGEPKDAFPEDLFYERELIESANGEVREEIREIEPLGADVRANTVADSIRKLKATEYLRLAAPILGLSFDEIYQREQRRLRARLYRILFGIIAASVIAVSFLCWQLFEVKQAQLHEDVIHAQQLYDTGDRVRSAEEAGKVLAGIQPFMSSEIKDTAAQLKFLSDIVPQLSVRTTICRDLSNNEVFFSSDGSGIVEFSSSALRTYDFDAELTSTFLLGRNQLRIAAVSRDGKRCVIVTTPSGKQAQLELWDLEQNTSVCPLLTCGPFAGSDGLAAVFSPDSRSVAVGRIGGEFNGNDELLIYRASDGRLISKESGLLLGTNMDGVRPGGADGLEFLDNDTVHWSGAAFHVFYSLGENVWRQVLRKNTERLAQEGIHAVNDRYLVVETDDGEYRPVDLAGKDGEYLTKLMNDSRYRILPVTQFGDDRCFYIREEEASAGFGKNKTTVSAISRIVVFQNLGSADFSGYFSDGNLSRYHYRKALLSPDGGYVLCSDIKKPDQLVLIGLDRGFRVIPLGESYTDPCFLGSMQEWDIFAGNGKSGAALFCLREDQPHIRSLPANIDMSAVNAISVSQSGWLIAKSSDKFCLYSLQDPLVRLDAADRQDAASFCVSENEQHWIRVSDYEMSNHNLNVSFSTPIRFYGIGNNGYCFAGNEAELQVYDPDGNAVIPPIPGAHAARISQNGKTLLWVEVNGYGYRTTTVVNGELHSMDLETKTETVYSPGIVWGRVDNHDDGLDVLVQVNVENCFDCTSDGSLIVIRSGDGLELCTAGISGSKQSWKPQNAEHPITRAAFTDTGDIICLQNDNLVTLLTDSKGTLQEYFSTTALSSAAATPELFGNILVFYGATIDLWDVGETHLIQSFPYSGSGKICWNQRAKWFTLADAETVSLYDGETFSKKLALTDNGWNVHDLDADHILLDDNHHIYRWDWVH